MSLGRSLPGSPSMSGAESLPNNLPMNSGGSLPVNPPVSTPENPPMNLANSLPERLAENLSGNRTERPSRAGMHLAGYELTACLMVSCVVSRPGFSAYNAVEFAGVSVGIDTGFHGSTTLSICSRPAIFGLPPTPLPPGHLVGSLGRSSATHDETSNQSYLETNDESSDDANDDRFNFRNKVASNARFSDGLRLRFRLRFSAGFSYRRACRCNRARS